MHQINLSDCSVPEAELLLRYRQNKTMHVYGYYEVQL